MTPEQVEGWPCCAHECYCPDDERDAHPEPCEHGCHASIPTPEQVEAFGARILAEINNPGWLDFLTDDRLAADRKRVESDVRAYRRNTEGLAEHVSVEQSYGDDADTVCNACLVNVEDAPCSDAARYTEGRDEAWQNLRDTSALYGVTPARRRTLADDIAAGLYDQPHP